MSSRLSLLALGLGVYLAVAIGSFPAAIAYRWFGPEGVALAAVEGTIWNGRAAYGAAGRLSFFNLRWHLHPAALLTGRLRLSAETELPGGLASAELTASSNRIELTEVRAATSLQSIRDAFALGEVSGRLSLSLTRFELVDGTPALAEGTVTIADLVVPPLFPTPGVSTIALGNFRAELTAGDRPGIVALVSDEGGPLELTAQVTLAPDRSYMIDALLKPRPGAPEVLVLGMEILPEAANAQGQRKFMLQGTL